MALRSPAGSHSQQDFIRLSGPSEDRRRWRPGGGPAARGRRPPDTSPYLRRAADDWEKRPRGRRVAEDWAQSPSARRQPAPPETPTGCPWMRPGKKYSRGVVGLHEEIEDFFQCMSPSVDEHHMRTVVFEKIRDVIRGLWSQAQVFIFGSFETGLYLPTSDIDMVVIGKWRSPPLEMLKDTLIGAGVCEYDSVKVLDKATVPIIKLTDRRSEVKVDISFNMSNGLVSANRIKQFAAEFPHLPRLVMVLKQFLLQRELNEVFTGGVSSYSLILMVVSFLQTHERYLGVFPGSNLGVLLIEFFELYGVKFNYHNTCIRVRERGYAPRSAVEDQFVGQSAHSSPLCIEDPHNPSNDIGRSSYHMLRVKEAFRHAYHRLRFSVLAPGSAGDPNRGSLLGRIVFVPERVAGYRRWIRTNFPAPEGPGPAPEAPAPEAASPDSSDNSDESQSSGVLLRELDEHIPETSAALRQRRQTGNPAWWTDACGNALRLRKRAFRDFNRLNSTENLVAFRKARSFARRTIREAKEAGVSDDEVAEVESVSMSR